MTRTALLAAAAFALAWALTGCGAEQQPVASVAEDVLRVGLDDYEVRTGADAIATGELRLEVRNVGGDGPDLRIDAGGAELAATEVLARGEAAELVVDVPAAVDELELWCTLPGHRSQGMTMTVPVRGDGETAAQAYIVEAPR